MKHCILILIAACCTTMMSWGQSIVHDSVQVSLPVGQDVPQQAITHQQPDTVKNTNMWQRFTSGVMQRIDAKLNEPYDTTRDNRYWWRAMKHGKINFKDSTMGYPKFVKFCYNTYKWGDRVFNSYDTAYVKSTGKNWKLILKSDNWMDSYIGHSSDGAHYVMNSNLVSNIGLSLSFMAVSVGYSIGVSNLIHGGKVSDKFEFSFTCARFAADAYYWENKNDMNITVNAKIDGEKIRTSIRQPGMIRKAMGLTAYYFFNNRRYSQSAAYCFSKYQKRSAGSWLAGFSLQHYDVKLDEEHFPNEVTFEDGETVKVNTRILYNDYCLLFGYGYNWVLGRKWLLNFTLTPYLGYRYHHFKSEDSPSSFSLNIRARVGAVYNHKQFFVGLQAFGDHHRYKSDSDRLVNSLLDFTALAGIRF